MQMQDQLSLDEMARSVGWHSSVRADVRKSTGETRINLFWPKAERAKAMLRAPEARVWTWAMTCGSSPAALCAGLSRYLWN